MLQEQTAPMTAAAKSRLEKAEFALMELEDNRRAVRTSTADYPANHDNLEDEPHQTGRQDKALAHRTLTSRHDLGNIRQAVMLNTKKTIIAPAVLLAICLVVACQSTQTDDSRRTAIENPHETLVQDYTLPPQDVQDLVNRSEAIVIGRVTAVSEPVKELPYFATEEDYADLPEWAVPWEEVVYFDIAIEEVLLDDGNISDNPRLQVGSGSASPVQGSRYLFTLHRNPDLLSYGVSAAWMALSLDGDEIRDLAGTAPGYIGVTDELSLADAVKDAAANHDFLPIGEWPLISPANVGGDSAPGGPNESNDPPGNTGDGEQ